MALKGSATIELTNVKTGAVERYEEHNLVTKALEYLHTPIGNLKAPCDLASNGEEPAYKSSLGGIVLWDSVIDEDESIITKPAGVKMVGCAAYGQTNTTESPCRGSFNESESYLTTSTTERSMKFVYDFATNQANGTIKSLSLTSLQGGWNGFGGDKNCVDHANYSSGGEYCYNMGRILKTPYWLNASLASPVRLICIDDEADVFYQLTSITTTKVNIAKRKAHFYQKSLLSSMYQVHELVESYSIELPSTLSGTNTYCYNYVPAEDVLYIVVSPSAASVAAAGAFYVIKVDMTSFTASVYSMTNKLSTALYCDDDYCKCYGDHLYYTYSSQSYTRKFSLADSTYTSIYLLGFTKYSTSLYAIYNGYLFIRGTRTISSTSYYRMLMIDLSDDNVVVTGYTSPPSYSGSYWHPIPFRGNPLLFYFFYSIDAAAAYLWVDNNYLATINNLSRTIEKTSDKTMKITYTIQEV